VRALAWFQRTGESIQQSFRGRQRSMNGRQDLRRRQVEFAPSNRIRIRFVDRTYRNRSEPDCTLDGCPRILLAPYLTSCESFDGRSESSKTRPWLELCVRCVQNDVIASLFEGDKPTLSPQFRSVCEAHSQTGRGQCQIPLRINASRAAAFARCSSSTGLTAVK